MVDRVGTKQVATTNVDNNKENKNNNDQDIVPVPRRGDVGTEKRANSSSSSMENVIANNTYAYTSTSTSTSTPWDQGGGYISNNGGGGRGPPFRVGGGDGRDRYDSRGKDESGITKQQHQELEPPIERNNTMEYGYYSNRNTNGTRHNDYNRYNVDGGNGSNGNTAAQPSTDVNAQIAALIAAAADDPDDDDMQAFNNICENYSPFVAAVLKDSPMHEMINENNELKSKLTDRDNERLLVEVTGQYGSPIYYKESLKNANIFGDEIFLKFDNDGSSDGFPLSSLDEIEIRWGGNGGVVIQRFNIDDMSILFLPDPGKSNIALRHNINRRHLYGPIYLMQGIIGPLPLGWRQRLVDRDMLLTDLLERVANENNDLTPQTLMIKALVFDKKYITGILSLIKNGDVGYASSQLVSKSSSKEEECSKTSEETSAGATASASTSASTSTSTSVAVAVASSTLNSSIPTKRNADLLVEGNENVDVGNNNDHNPLDDFTGGGFGDDIAEMKYHIHNFADRKDKRFYTGTINAHGHPWKLMIYPRGHAKSATNAEYVSVFLKYVGENTKTDPVVAKAMIQTKTTSRQLPKAEYCSSEGKYDSWGLGNFSKREDVITNDCNDAGTLTITIELQVATEAGLIQENKE
ncbi:hypothetical protein FRACYDRAFT_240867 [Fragilariopsis cylindrus CCMP1102]|uniref:MATH domain-containing protein n=1 Tax=Fragilariopsis cylindrus CCMP1102 TaxID=635003 RepID=A0A1E7F814_9STRA|nr:hypothetical protein FRACYDRAFT_240867 [Fragilariopsis cylindrus CCMP1102]|eukprot:OEU14332.1 hypothetical protein FRACYDRAFT_240867 [Fragilariopsis cylindrus CCMP1102]